MSAGINPPMIEYLAITALALACLAGLLLAAFQLPGVWLILIAGMCYDWRHGFAAIGWKWLAALAVVALAGEVIETLASVAMARRVGAGRRAAVGALLGGFAGMFLLSLPLPLIGTIAGGVLGCFAGAALAEWTNPDFGLRAGDDRLAHGARVGVFAAIGRVLGLMVKLAAAFVVAGAVLTLAIAR